MTASITGLRAGDVIWVSFPYVESQRAKVRPALVVSDKMVGPGNDILWAMMITNALRPSWPGDLIIDDHVGVGLPHPSKIRTAKIATLEMSSAERIGQVGKELLAQVRDEMARTLGV